MEFLTLENIIMAICGVIFHSLVKINKLRKSKANFNLIVWVKDNTITLAMTVISIFVLLYMGEDIHDFFGIHFNKLTAFWAGYSNNSILRNIIKTFDSKLK